MPYVEETRQTHVTSKKLMVGKQLKVARIPLAWGKYSNSPAIKFLALVTSAVFAGAAFGGERLIPFVFLSGSILGLN